MKFGCDKLLDGFLDGYEDAVDNGEGGEGAVLGGGDSDQKALSLSS